MGMDGLHVSMNIGRRQEFIQFNTVCCSSDYLPFKE
jgi:hypothetical protein